MKRTWEVRVVYRGQLNYLVAASSPEEAEAKAREAYAEGDEPANLGNEWEEIERVDALQPVEAPAATGVSLDGGS